MTASESRNPGNRVLGILVRHNEDLCETCYAYCIRLHLLALNGAMKQRGIPTMTQ